jgi:AcrR family transcriptional regulator
MDKPDGQDAAASRRGPGSEQTRLRLLQAAAELIAEQGWGAVRTRAVAERAGLPHGAVSYHFRGKQELLTEAALYTFARAVPLEGLVGEQGTPPDVVELIEGWLTGAETTDPVVTGVGMEAMLQAERDPVLRRRLAELMGRYREAMTDLVASSQRHRTTKVQTDPAGLAALLAAIGDGLFLHARIDPQLDTEAALTALRDLLTR